MIAKSKVWFDVNGAQTLGQGKVSILKSIDGTGSINATAKVLGRSYRHVWSAIQIAEKRMGSPLLIKHQGGSKGGGTVLTQEAKTLIAKYEQLDKEVRVYTDRRFKKLFAGVLTTIFAVLTLVSSSQAEEILRLATTTSTYETGLLDHILPSFEKKHNAKVHIISVGTGKAIKLGENGDVDIILVHARKAEEKFVEDGFGVNRRDVMYNDFVILGPKEDPAGIRKSTGVAKALKNIMTSSATFISRGDDSGTHKKEKHIWALAKTEPKGKWYLESGQGMSATLRMADEKNAYVMVDRATYIFNKKAIRLELLLEKDPVLLNPYGIIAVSPYKHKHVRYELSIALIAWMTSPECQKMIGKYKKSGEQLYHPNANVIK